MVFLFQIFFFAVVIGSSFFGLDTFFTVVAISLLFTLVNVYTLPLLLLQSSVIICTSIIGLIIATIVSIKKDEPKRKARREQRLRIEKSKTKQQKQQDAKFMGFLILCIIVFILLRIYIPNMSEGFLFSFFNIIFFLIKVILTISIPGIISDIFDLNPDGCGCLVLGVLAIIVFWII